ncbi:GNAT family N-acetyltransferase [Aliiroseovarius sp. YM-037]|uniref:GNAT family N-acetyltransferase n=1 Tax=Aliiroseovarius sp. YM-037 TaxID=3341728 RepID=UPI003A807B36
MTAAKANITIAPGDPRSAEAVALLTASHTLMRSACPPESNHFLSIDQLTAANIRFYLARVGEEAFGCAALAVRDEYGELKSMYVAEAARGLGIAQALLDQIEATARAEDLSLLRLETGSTLHAAQRFYERAGYTRRGPFGDYSDDPLSVFMERAL